MKKSFWFFTALIVITAAYFLNSIFPYVCMYLGKRFYYKKNYTKAYKCLDLAIKIEPNDRNIRYYYIQTLITFKPTLKVQKEIYNFSQRNLPDTADLIADKKVTEWRNNILYKTGDNYIKNVTINNRVLRWDRTKFPLVIDIHIKDGTGLPQYYNDAIKNAFNQWQVTAGELLSFSLTDYPESAQIIVSFVPAQERDKCKEGQECKYAIAYTKPVIQGNLLQKMGINFYSTDKDGSPFNEKLIYNIALHEIGHSLGMMGHSPNKNDLMYPQVTPQSEFSKLLENDFQFITQNDLNTLVLLYKLVPDITNTPLDKFNTANQYYAPIVLGSKTRISTAKIIEAKNYILLAPQLPNGYIDLAIAYTDAREYNNALTTLNRALPLCTNDQEKFLAYYDFAVIYTTVKDWNNALKYAQLAKDLNPESDVDSLIALINYNMGKKDVAKKIYIQTTKAKPDNIIDSINLATIYFEEFNLKQAGKTLNNLVKANPAAAKDKRIKKFKLLMLLFK